jgi:hypothetical protein
MPPLRCSARRDRLAGDRRAHMMIAVRAALPLIGPVARTLLQRRATATANPARTLHLSSASRTPSIPADQLTRRHSCARLIARLSEYSVVTSRSSSTIFCPRASIMSAARVRSARQLPGFQMPRSIRMRVRRPSGSLFVSGLYGTCPMDRDQKKAAAAGTGARFRRRAAIYELASLAATSSTMRAAPAWRLRTMQGFAPPCLTRDIC